MGLENEVVSWAFVAAAGATVSVLSPNVPLCVKMRAKLSCATADKSDWLSAVMLVGQLWPHLSAASRREFVKSTKRELQVYGKKWRTVFGRLAAPIECSEEIQ